MENVIFTRTRALSLESKRERCGEIRVIFFITSVTNKFKFRYVVMQDPMEKALFFIPTIELNGIKRDHGFCKRCVLLLDQLKKVVRI